MLTGLIFAIAGMLFNSVAGFLQSEATRRVGAHGHLMTQPCYTGGLAVDGLGWACTVVALRHLPVFVVQAILGASIAVTAIVVRMFRHTALRGIDRVAVTICLVGLVLVAASAGDDVPSPVSMGAVIMLCCAALLLTATLAVARHSRNAPLLAVIAGLSFGGTSLAVRATHHHAGGLTGIAGLVTEPAAYLVVCFWLMGLISYTRALATGSLARVTAVFLATEVIFPGVLGIALLGDSVRSGWGLSMAAGLLLAALGVVILSNSPAHSPDRRAIHSRQW